MNCVSIAVDEAWSVSTIGPVTSRSAASGADVNVSTRFVKSGRPSAPVTTTPLIHSQSGYV